MKILYEDNSTVYYEEAINGFPVRHMVEKDSLKLWIHADDILAASGVSGTIEDYLKTDEGLDFINWWGKVHPGKPLGLILSKFEIPKHEK